MTKTLTNVDFQNIDSEEIIRMTPSALAQYLRKNSRLAVSEEKKLVIYDIDLNDFLDVSKTVDANQRLLVLGKIINRYSLDLTLDGSVVLGALNLDDHSWTLSGGPQGPLTISAKPAALRKSLSDIAAFLHLLPRGQNFVLKPFQDLFLTGLSADALIEYYKFSQENTDVASREQQQEKLFASECLLLTEKRETLKIYGMNVTQIDRFIDVNAGGIVFKASGSNDQMPPAIVLGLASYIGTK